MEMTVQLQMLTTGASEMIRKNETTLYMTYCIWHVPMYANDLRDGNAYANKGGRG